MGNIKYIPGNEPETLKVKLQRFFEKVNTAYPDKTISGFAKDHKKWSEALTKLRRELGYEDNTAFWEAYGYTVVVQGLTAPKTADDYEYIIEELKKRYEGRTCSAMNRLSIENPDISGKIKTLQNKSQSIFGMTLKDKLIAEGILENRQQAKGYVKIPQEVQEERFRETLQILKDKYINTDEKPSSLTELNIANKDLPLNTRFYSYIKTISGKKTEEYLAEQGIIYNEKIGRKSYNRDDFDISQRGILRQYKGNDSTVIIPDCVKKILKKAFDGRREKIVELIIPNSVEIIENNAFSQLTHLKTVKLSNKLKVIETSLFYGCNKLCDVVIPEGVEIIKSVAFYRCDSIKRINIPSTVKKIESDAWLKAESIEEFIVDNENECYTSVNGVIYNKEKTELCFYPLGKNAVEFIVPNGIKTIGEGAFAYNKLKTVVLPDGLENIERGAFHYSNSLEKVDVPNSIKKLGAHCFSNCTNLSCISLPDNVEEGPYSFGECHALAKDGFIIINDVLYGCTFEDVSKLSVPSGVKTVKEFSYIIRCKEMYIPDSVEYLCDIPYSTEYVSVPSTLKNLNEVKNMVKNWETKLFVRPDKNNDQFIKYYVIPDLNDLNGKGILLDIRDEQLETKTRAILKYCNASIKKVMSKNVDYVVTDDSIAYYMNEKHSETVKACISNTDKTGTPMLIIVDELVEANRSYFNNRFVSMSNSEKLSYALSLYDICIKKVETMMKNISEYSDPICSNDTEIGAKLHPNAKLSDADDFLDKVARFNQSWGIAHSEILQSYRSIYEEVFSKHGSDLSECVGIETAVAIAVACFVYGTPDCKIHTEWVRNKWESRGDYSSSFNIAFELSSSFPEGRIFRSEKDAYDM